MVGTIALLDDRLNLATGQSPLLVWVLVAATLLVVAGPGVRDARSRGPASRSGDASFR